jgi:hypothetical protein
MSFTVLKNSGFVGALSQVKDKNPRAVWISNKSCAGAGVPEIVTWLEEGKNLPGVFLTGTAKHLKPYLRDLLRSGAGNTDCAAVTLAIAGWTLPARLQNGVPLRHVLIGSASLNQDIKGAGQVHAEDIATNIVIDALPAVLTHYQWPGATLTSLDVLIYEIKTNGSDFVPCGACQRTLTAKLQPYKAQIGTVSMLGAGLDLG